MTNRRILRALPCATFMLLLICCLAASQTTPTVPTLVKFSGTVREASSRIIGVTFALYKDEQGGAPLWMETQSVRLDSSGHYSVQLGATFPAGLPAELFASGEARWLGVQPEGQTEQSRVLLLSVPYALKAADAETLGGLPASAFVLAGNRALGTSTAGTHRVGSAVKSNLTPNGPTSSVTTSGGTVNTLPLFSTATDIENSVITQSGTSIGIGVSSPVATLDVSGAANVRGYVNAAYPGYKIAGTLFDYSNGYLNAFLGYGGNLGSTGGSNVAVGYQALAANTSGSQNIALGPQAMASNMTGGNNVAVGIQALGGQSNTGSNNAAIGLQALYNNSGGGFNTATGPYALLNNTIGGANTASGEYALQFNKAGNYNTGIGFNAGTDAQTTSLWNATAIGANADVTVPNALVLGSIAGINSANADANVGIGVTAPTARLHIGSPSSYHVGATSLRVEGPSQQGTGGFAASFGGWGDFNIDAFGWVGGRFTVKESGLVGIGTPSPDNTLSVNGTADKPGGGSWGTYSDRRLKDLKGNFGSGLSQVLRINPVRYRYKATNGMEIHDSAEHVGLVAQEVQKVIPEAVSENSKGYLLVNNDPIIWAMLNAIKEQQQQIRKQRALVRAQQAAIRDLRSQLQDARRTLSIIKTQLESTPSSALASISGPRTSTSR